MKPAVALLALALSACSSPVSDLNTALTGPKTPAQPAGPDTCAVARPSFGGMATETDLALFAYDTSAALDLQVTPEGTVNDVQAAGISFASPGGGRATGFLLDPVTRSGLRPAVVLMHGMPGFTRQMQGYGQLLAQLGAVVIAIDAPFARRGGPPVQFTPQDRAEQIQLMKDLRRAVDVLRGRANVDPARIAYVGVSYGGAMGALFVGIEPRLRGAALVVADGGLVSHFTGPEDLTYLGSLSCATRVSWFRDMVPIEPIRYIGHAAPRPLLLQNGRLDNLVPAPDAEELHAWVQEPRTILWYAAGHGLDQQAHFDRLDWLRETIGIDPRP